MYLLVRVVTVWTQLKVSLEKVWGFTMRWCDAIIFDALGWSGLVEWRCSGGGANANGVSVLLARIQTTRPTSCSYSTTATPPAAFSFSASASASSFTNPDYSKRGKRLSLDIQPNRLRVLWARTGRHDLRGVFDKLLGLQSKANAAVNCSQLLQGLATFCCGWPPLSDPESYFL